MFTACIMGITDLYCMHALTHTHTHTHTHRLTSHHRPSPQQGLFVFVEALIILVQFLDLMQGLLGRRRVVEVRLVFLFPNRLLLLVSHQTCREDTRQKPT